MSSGKEVTAPAAPATTAAPAQGNANTSTQTPASTPGAANTAAPSTAQPAADGGTANAPNATSTAGTTVENTPFKIYDGLNPLALDTHRSRLDTKTSTVEGQLRNLIIDANKRNIFEGTNRFYGQVLRVIDDLAKCESYYLRKIFKDNVGLDVKGYKVIIPELHRLLPQPKSFDQTEEDKVIIGMYPDFAFIPSSDANSAEIKVGNIVNCEFGNLAEQTDGKVISIATNVIQPSTAGAGGTGGGADGWSGRVECADKPPGSAPWKPEITIGQFRKGWPGALAVYPNEILPLLNKYWTTYGYNTLKRVAGVMGQFEAEVGQGIYLEEYGPDTRGKYINSKGTPAAQAKLNYYGRGMIGLTWWDNYKKMDDALGLGGKLFNNPGLLVSDKDLFVKASLKFLPLFYGDKFLTWLDNWDLLTVSKRVNGTNAKTGFPNGWPKRRDAANRWITILDKDCKVVENPPAGSAANTAPRVEKKEEKTAMILGDSHMVGPLGDNLEKLLTGAGYKVTRICQGSATATSFWDGKELNNKPNKITSLWAEAKGGPVLVTKTQAPNASGGSSGPSSSGPNGCDPAVQTCADTSSSANRTNVKTTESRIPYKLLFLSIGTNDAGAVRNDQGAISVLNNAKRVLTETNAEIKFWCGPPAFSARGAKEYNPAAFSEFDLNQRAELIYKNASKVLNGIAWQLDVRPATKGYPPPGKEIHFEAPGGKAWAEYVFGEIKKKVSTSS